MNWNLYLRDFFSVIDRLDSRNFAAAFSESGSFRFANFPPAVGRPGIAAVADSVFDHLLGIEHRVVGFGTSTPSDAIPHLYVEGIVVYHRKDDVKIELPFACAFEFASNSVPGDRPLIERYRSYIDAAPLYAPAEVNGTRAHAVSP